MAYIVSVRTRYCQILRFKARSNDGPGFGRRSNILDERLCPLGASLVPCSVRCVELTPEAVSGAAWSYPFISERTATRLCGRVARRSVHQGSGAIVVIRIDTSVDAAIRLLGDRIANVRRKRRSVRPWLAQREPATRMGSAPTVLLAPVLT